MAILHGSWLINAQGGFFFLWGETWRRLSPADFPQFPTIDPYPYAMVPGELVDWCNSQAEIAPLISHLNRLPHGSIPIALPTQIPEDTHHLIPGYSASPLPPAPHFLYPWILEGLTLDAITAIEFLQALPLNPGTPRDSVMGADLRFWSHIARWHLDLLARRKFLPALERDLSGTAITQWHPLLDSATDQTRLEQFSQRMPFACRAYQQGENATNPCLDLPAKPAEILRHFLSATLDAHIRLFAQAETLDKKLVNRLNPLIRKWLQNLGAGAPLDLPPSDLETLETVLNTWKAPLQYSLSEQPFRTCFWLHPPLTGSTDWTLQYCLQAVDKPDFLVDAHTIWNHPFDQLLYKGRTLDLPQENLLRGLGLASKLYPLIEPSLQERSPQSCRLTPAQAYEFIVSCAWRFTDSGLGVVLPPSLAQRDSQTRLGLSIRAETPTAKKDVRLGLQSLLNFKWELSLAGHTLTKAQFDRLVAQNSPLVLINDQWVELRPAEVRAAQTFFASRQAQMSLTLEDALRLASGDTQTLEKLPVVNFSASGQLQELLNTLTQNRSLEPIPVPKNFQGELRPYQIRGAGWLAFLERWGLGACLADDMGLGKTIQTITFLLHLQEENALRAPVLLVCPTSVLGNWEREIKKFGASLKVLVHHGDQRNKGKALAKAIEHKNLVITSYALVHRDEKTLETIEWQGIILDEAQNIKNPDAKQSQVVRQLKTQFRIALTGTPIENRLSELWSILDFLNPGYLGNRAFFQRRFAIPIEKYGDGDSLQTLRSLVQPFILRRLKTDHDIIQDLPEKQEMTVFCPLANEQAVLYQQIVDESLTAIDDADGIQRRGMILALLIKLKQVCNHPILVQGTEGKSHQKKQSSLKGTASGKLQRLTEMLDEIVSEGDRALVFTQFAEWGKLLKPYLENQLGQEVLYLYGGTRKNQREEIVDRFQSDPQGPPILLLSLKAGGTGLNLTRANHVFHFDRWWNPAVENQATDRAFRIGQTQNVQVHKFVCTGTLEEKIHDLLESKSALAQQVVGAGEQWLTELDTQQLRQLLILDRSTIVTEES